MGVTHSIARLVIVRFMCTHCNKGAGTTVADGALQAYECYDLCHGRRVVNEEGLESLATVEVRSQHCTWYSVQLFLNLRFHTTCTVLKILCSSMENMNSAKIEIYNTIQTQ